MSTNGISQIMNCGENTLSNATSAVTTAAHDASKRSRVGAPAMKRSQTATSAASPAIVVASSTACTPVPERFWEPKPLTTLSELPVA